MVAPDKQLKVEGNPGRAITPAPSYLPANLVPDSQRFLRLQAKLPQDCRSPDYFLP